MFRVLPLVLACLAPAALAQDLSGPLRVIDGDTFEMNGERIRLFALDAPEDAQTCTTARGSAWDCGAWVTAEVTARLEGRPARCAGIETDRYGRIVARCTVDGQDLGEMLVAAGLAMAARDYGLDYDLTEKTAQLQGLGIWQGEVQAPAAFRAAQATPDTPPLGDCLIKGNISGNGQIYHQPGDPSYAETRISPDRGERWFCTPAEAEAAGWRAARD